MEKLSQEDKAHAPEFIAEMKDRLLADRERLQSELDLIARPAPQAGEYTANFPDYGRNDEDNATEIADHTANVSTENIIEKQLNDIVAALQRIEDGNFGLTDAGEIIPEDRLRANPAATTLVK